MKNILDFSIDNETRMIEFEKYCKDVNDVNISFELINQLNGIYQFSGMKILQDFLYKLSFNSNIDLDSILKLKASQGLLLFDEIKELDEKDDDDETIKLKKESNLEIDNRNKKRKHTHFTQ